MMRQERSFPLVADDEFVLDKNPVMNLYDESDLISNIRGPYQEKDFGSVTTPTTAPPVAPTTYTEEELLPPLFEAKPSRYSRKERQQQLAKPKSPAIKTQGQLAREQAREDLKKKRSATYLRDEKVIASPQRAKAPLATPPAEPQPKVERMTRLADKLRQTEYILADMPAVYSLRKEDREQASTVKKNSYDFLKKSQVYNYPERTLQRERQLAQELNLTHIEEERHD